jgi:hypothetical protein
LSPFREASSSSAIRIRCAIVSPFELAILPWGCGLGLAENTPVFGFPELACFSICYGVLNVEL